MGNIGLDLGLAIGFTDMQLQITISVINYNLVDRFRRLNSIYRYRYILTIWYCDG